MSAPLRAEGYNIGRYKARNLMRKAGVSYTYKKKFKPTTDSNHNLPLAQNLWNRKFNVDQPNTTWCADISYLWTNEGWLYLAVVIDLVFSQSRWMGYQQTDESIPGERGSGDGLFSTSTW
jgi:transposase InsO family protein